MRSLNAVRVAALAAVVPPFPYQRRVLEFLQPFGSSADYLEARELVSFALAEMTLATPFPNTEKEHARCYDALTSLDAHILELIRAA